MDLLTARNGAPPPPVQTKSTRNEGRKRSFWRWQRRALKAARDHEGREAAEAVQAAERNQQRAAQRRAKAAALDRKTAARHRLHRNCLLWYHKQIKKGARILKQQKEKRAAEERRKCRRQQHDEMLQRAAERKRRRRERYNLTAALAQCRHWRLGLKMLLLLVIFAAYLECAAAMPRGNVAAAAAGAGQRQRTLFSHGFSVSASSRTGIASTPGAGPPPPRDDGGGGTGSVVAGRDERDDGSSSEEEEARSEEEEEEEEGELETAVTQLEERAARRKRQRKNREASWRSLFENECSCRGDNEDDDEEDDDYGDSLRDGFLVDDDLADTNDDERQDVTFWARVTREMDRRAGEKEEEPPDEEEDPDDDPTEAETPLDVCCFRSHRAWNCWSGRPAGCWKYTARAPSRNKGKETAKRGHRKAS